MAFFAALEAVENEARGEVPSHLKDASRDAQGFGHGQGYLYPHAYRDHFVAQQYLPDALQGRLFYQPSDQGAEAAVRAEVARRREAQLAAMLDDDAHAPPEILSWSPGDAARDRWAARTLSGRGERIVRLRDEAFARLDLARHHLILDLSGGSGWTTFEALRRSPDGQTWAVADDEQAAATIRGQTEALPELERPIVRIGRRASPSGAVQDAAPFDRVLALRLLGATREVGELAAELAALLAPGGRILFGDPLLADSSRLTEVADLSELPARLVDALQVAEEAAYQRSSDPRFAYTPERATEQLEAHGLRVERSDRSRLEERRSLPSRAFDVWFAAGAPFHERLVAAGLSHDELARLEARLRAALQDRESGWSTPWAWLRVGRASDE
jgi:putative ATPase